MRNVLIDDIEKHHLLLHQRKQMRRSSQRSNLSSDKSQLRSLSSRNWMVIARSMSWFTQMRIQRYQWSGETVMRRRLRMQRRYN